ncbi:hypothetical protein BK022_00300 [Methylorubrum extorquens]|uniref:Uncharacterized protein n=1 Tax=Methylorubrum extorquens TaxID=408 RepID=A0A1S1P5Q7_METEX|nr:hypothetical protein BK022_00300 [Methylorubrum extorquens]
MAQETVRAGAAVDQIVDVNDPGQGRRWNGEARHVAGLPRSWRRGGAPQPSRAARRRRALPITLTEDSAITAAAMPER